MPVNDQQFDQKLALLVGNVNATSAGAASVVLAESQQRAAQLHRTAAALQESLDSLRMSVKYLVFDLEATRRENAALKLEIDTLRKDDDDH